jgi:hydroxyquinol 1,2-dioxygenase
MPDGLDPKGQDGRRSTSEDDITAEVLARFSATPDPRLRQIMLALIKHLHAFVKEVELTETEWFQAIEILTEAGKMCSDKRQEFILFSDTLGVSMVVDLIGHRKPEGATESTVFGPFHRLGSPDMPAGGNIAHHDTTGIPALVSGRVLDLDGKPIAGAVLDVWQAQTNGLYDSQDKNPDELHMRGKFTTDSEGRYLLRTVQPVNYPIPSDGPVGSMLKATGRHPWRPAHIHFVVMADGYDAVTTHIFDRHRPVSRKRCGVRGQGIADLRLCSPRDTDAGSRKAWGHRAGADGGIRFRAKAGGRGGAGQRARRPASSRRLGRQSMTARVH